MKLRTKLVKLIIFLVFLGFFSINVFAGFSNISNFNQFAPITLDAGDGNNVNGLFKSDIDFNVTNFINGIDTTNSTNWVDENNVAIACSPTTTWTSTGATEVDLNILGWGTTDTNFMFRIPSDINVQGGTTDNTSCRFFRDTTAGALTSAARDWNNVWMFADDFEDGDISDWTNVGGLTFDLNNVFAKGKYSVSARQTVNSNRTLQHSGFTTESTHKYTFLTEWFFDENNSRSDFVVCDAVDVNCNFSGTYLSNFSENLTAKFKDSDKTESTFLNIGEVWKKKWYKSKIEITTVDNNAFLSGDFELLQNHEEMVSRPTVQQTTYDTIGIGSVGNITAITYHFDNIRIVKKSIDANVSIGAFQSFKLNTIPDINMNTAPNTYYNNDFNIDFNVLGGDGDDLNLQIYRSNKGGDINSFTNFIIDVNLLISTDTNLTCVASDPTITTNCKYQLSIANFPTDGNYVIDLNLSDESDENKVVTTGQWIVIDTTRPTITQTDYNAEKWQNFDVNVSVSATDDLSFDKLFYRIDTDPTNATSFPTTWTAYDQNWADANFFFPAISGDGNFSIRLWARDYAGNGNDSNTSLSDVNQLDALIDASPPTGKIKQPSATITVSKTTISWDLNDTTSGVLQDINITITGTDSIDRNSTAFDPTTACVQDDKNWVCQYDEPLISGDGTYTIKIAFEDKADNSTSISRIFNYISPNTGGNAGGGGGGSSPPTGSEIIKKLKIVAPQNLTFKCPLGTTEWKTKMTIKNPTKYNATKMTIRTEPSLQSFIGTQNFPTNIDSNQTKTFDVVLNCEQLGIQEGRIYLSSQDGFSNIENATIKVEPANFVFFEAADKLIKNALNVFEKFNDFTIPIIGLIIIMIIIIYLGVK